MRTCWLTIILCFAVPSSLIAQIPKPDSVPMPTPAQDPQQVPPDSVTKAPSENSPYQPITSRQRMEWFFLHSVGPESLGTGLFIAGIGTARNKPKEYGGIWPGYVKRYGMRLTGLTTSNAMEAGAGAIWGEDPRYFRANGKSFGARWKNVVVLTVAARRRDGRLHPAYARLMAIPGNNFLSNTWRADSEATTSAALSRTAFGFLGRFTANAFQEFWPSFKLQMFHPAE